MSLRKQDGTGFMELMYSYPYLIDHIWSFIELHLFDIETIDTDNCTIHNNWVDTVTQSAEDLYDEHNDIYRKRVLIVHQLGHRDNFVIQVDSHYRPHVTSKTVDMIEQVSGWRLNCIGPICKVPKTLLSNSLQASTAMTYLATPYRITVRHLHMQDCAPLPALSIATSIGYRPHPFLSDTDLLSHLELYQQADLNGMYILMTPHIIPVEIRYGKIAHPLPDGIQKTRSRLITMTTGMPIAHHVTWDRDGNIRRVNKYGLDVVQGYRIAQSCDLIQMGVERCPVPDIAFGFIPGENHIDYSSSGELYYCPYDTQ